MSEIRINYDEMRAAASDFQTQAEATQQIIDTLNRRAGQLMAGWEGVAEMSFMHELESCRQRLRRVPEMLSEISYALRSTADRIQQAEQEAARAMSGSVTGRE